MIGKNQIRKAVQTLEAKAVRDKFDATYMKGKGKVSKPSKTTSQKILGWVSQVLQRTS
jgi:hypothetical protein